MIEKFYVLVWLLLIVSATASIFTGAMNELAMVTFGLIALGLVHVFLWWSTLRNPERTQ